MKCVLHRLKCHFPVLSLNLSHRPTRPVCCHVAASPSPTLSIYSSISSNHADSALRRCCLRTCACTPAMLSMSSASVVGDLTRLSVPGSPPSLPSRSRSRKCDANRVSLSADSHPLSHPPPYPCGSLPSVPSRPICSQLHGHCPRLHLAGLAAAAMQRFRGP